MITVLSTALKALAAWLRPYVDPLWESKPRRVIYLFATGTILLLSIYLPFQVIIPSIARKLPAIERISEYRKILDISPRDALGVSVLCAALFLYLLAVLFGGWLVSESITSHIVEQFSTSLIAANRFVASADRVQSELRKGGIEELVPIDHGPRGGMAIKLDSSTIILDEARRSNSIRALTMVGWEYFGGKSSLLYSLIEENPKLSVEVVMVDRSLGEMVLKDRAAALSGIRPISFEVLRAHSNEVEAQLLALNKDRQSRAAVYKFPRKPPFRLLILDDCMFMSLYCPDCEGHESVMFKIAKKLDGGLHSNWFEALHGLYENCKIESTRVSTPVQNET